MELADTLTLEAIARDPWNAVRLPVPADADCGMLDQLAAVAGAMADQKRDQGAADEWRQAETRYEEIMQRMDEQNCDMTTAGRDVADRIEALAVATGNAGSPNADAFKQAQTMRQEAIAAAPTPAVAAALTRQHGAAAQDYAGDLAAIRSTQLETRGDFADADAMRAEVAARREIAAELRGPMTPDGEPTLTNERPEDTDAALDGLVEAGRRADIWLGAVDQLLSDTKPATARQPAEELTLEDIEQPAPEAPEIAEATRPAADPWTAARDGDHATDQAAQQQQEAPTVERPTADAIAPFEEPRQTFEPGQQDYAALRGESPTPTGLDAFEADLRAAESAAAQPAQEEPGRAVAKSRAEIVTTDTAAEAVHAQHAPNPIPVIGYGPGGMTIEQVNYTPPDHGAAAALLDATNWEEPTRPGDVRAALALQQANDAAAQQQSAERTSSPGDRPADPVQTALSGLEAFEADMRRASDLAEVAAEITGNEQGQSVAMGSRGL